MRFNNILFLVFFMISIPSFASNKVGTGGVFSIARPITETSVDGGGVSNIKVGTGGISFAGPGVGGGGVSIKVGGEGMGDSYNDGTTFEISDAMLGKLKKLGVEKLLLENGETVDLSGDVNAY